MPLYELLFSVYSIIKLNLFLIEECLLDWNDFFQFVLFYGVAPMPAIFYTLFNILPNYDGRITWECIGQLFIYLRRNLAICPEIKQVFSEHDINNDGELSLSQFFNFASTTTALYQPLYDFRITIIEKIIGSDMILGILNRKLRISDIKIYQSENSGKFPAEPCLPKIKRLLKGFPHPDYYDYDCEDISLSFVRFVLKYIRLFKPQMNYRHEAFQMKNLGRFGGIITPTLGNGSDPNVKVTVKDKNKTQHGSSSNILCQIDKFYIQYRMNSPEKQSSIKQQQSVLVQHAISFQQSEYSLPPSARSILRAPSHRNTPTTTNRKIGTPNINKRLAHGNRHLSIGHETKLATKDRHKNYRGGNSSPDGGSKQNSAQSLTMMSDMVNSRAMRKNLNNNEEKADTDPLLSPVPQLRL